MAVPFTENGGFRATALYLFIPSQKMDTGQTFIGVFDPTDFNDTVDGSIYFFRAEDIAMGRVPTVRRVILTYRDIGQATITLALFASNDLQQVITQQVKVTIGNTTPTMQLLTVFVDVVITGFRPQLAISRLPGAGPVSIVSVTLVGEIEEVSQ